MQHQFDAQLVRALINDGDGSLVLTRYAGISGDSPCISIPTDVGPLWMQCTDMVMRPILKLRGRWEPDEAAFLEGNIAAGSTVVNVGANIGYTSLVLSRIVGPTGLVIALEPEPLNFKLLCINTARAGNVLPVHTAAGYTSGTIRLNRSATNAGDHRTGPHEDAVGGVDVPIVTLDELLGDRTIAAIATDAQGFDHRVIAGAAKLIERCHPVITVEYASSLILNIGDDPEEVIAGYRRLGYSKMIDVPSGDDLSVCTAQQVTTRMAATHGHTTIALLP